MDGWFSHSGNRIMDFTLSCFERKTKEIEKGLDWKQWSYVIFFINLSANVQLSIILVRNTRLTLTVKIWKTENMNCNLRFSCFLRFEKKIEYQSQYLHFLCKQTKRTWIGFQLEQLSEKRVAVNNLSRFCVWLR